MSTGEANKEREREREGERELPEDLIARGRQRDRVRQSVSRL